MPNWNMSGRVPTQVPASGSGNNPYGINPSSSTYAGDTYAALTRDQWNTYYNVFRPIENQLIDYATDRNKPTEAMAEASSDVNAAYTAQQGAMGRRLRGLGVTLSDDEQAAQTRSFGLSKSLADVNAQNTAGALTTQRQQSIIGNPAPQASGG